MKKIQVIVLAAGLGKRMKSPDLPKAMVPLNGRPMIDYCLKAIKKSGIDDTPIVVVGQKREQVTEYLGPKYTYIVQKEQLGTGHAVASTRQKLEGKVAHVLVLYADNPLIESGTIKRLAKVHLQEGVVLTMAVVKAHDFQGWRKSLYSFGRIIRDKNSEILESIEVHDATEEQKQMREVNPSIYCFESQWLWQNIKKLVNNNVQGEFYLTDLIGLALSNGKKIATVEINAREALGVNTMEQLAFAAILLRRDKAEFWEEQKGD